MFHCQNCNCERVFQETDYYGFDYYECPVCGDVFSFPSDAYAPPEDDEDDMDDEAYESPICDACNGTGQTFDLEECAECDGMGYKWWL